jgi:FAD/FMN-containing dehydrogenase
MPATTPSPDLGTALAGLRATVRGSIHQAGDPGYDDARTIWNGIHDLHPAVVVEPLDATDVAAAIRFAVARNLPIAIRGGGHGVAGNGSVDDGLMLNLRGMRSVTIDVERRIVRAGPGATLADVDAATQAHGLAVPIGVISGTGVAGLTLGGGVGWLTRAYGLAADNLVAADVVLADGSLARAAADADAATSVWSRPWSCRRIRWARRCSPARSSMSGRAGPRRSGRGPRGRPACLTR